MIPNSDLQTHTGGIINLAVMAGNDDPEKYMKSWNRDSWKSGGYKIQMSPHDIAAMINHARHLLKGKRMLCVGVETFGAERLIAEELGMLQVDVIGEAHPISISGCKINWNPEPSGTYDLVTIFGNYDFNLKEILRFTKTDSLVACLNTNIKAGMPGLRQAWFELRRTHYAILQNVIQLNDMGVGMVKITHTEERNAISVKGAEGLFVRQSPGHSQTISSGNTQRSETSHVLKETQDSQQPIDSKPVQPRNNGEAGIRPGYPDGEDGSIQQDDKAEEGQREEGKESRNQGQGNREGRKESEDVRHPEEAGRESSSGASVQEEEIAPYGRKKEGTPKKRSGKPIGGWKK